MSYKSEKAVKQLKEKHQLILNELLREEANRYCADCEAKGPRWASWNIGVFVCIRCAGIHRNLGVHISRVKSVNLDSWTTEQIESIEKWGNRRAKEYYECYLPDDFVRPQGDSAMETFIRNKYERKLYIRKGGEPPPNRVKESKVVQPKKKEKQSETSQEKLSVIAAKSKVNQNASPPKSNVSAVSVPYSSHMLPQKSNNAPVIDLLGMENPAPKPEAKEGLVQNADEFSLFMQASTAYPSSQNQTQSFSQSESAPNSTQSQGAESLLLEEKETAKSRTKESILSLYQCGNQQQKPIYGVPGGVYMTQQQQSQIRDQPNVSSFAMQGMNKPQMGMTQLGAMRMDPSQMSMNQNAMMMNQNEMLMKQNMRMGFPNNRGQQNLPYMSNMMSMQNQMQNMNLGHVNQFTGQPGGQANQMMSGMNRPQYPLGNIQTNLGQAMMSNSYGPNRPMMPSQQVILANGPAAGYTAGNMTASHNMGHTLNNQLWK